jgi:hypothetical protein
MDNSAIDEMVAQIDLDDINEADDYVEEDTEEWGAMVDDSRNLDLGVTNEGEVNIQEAFQKTEQQKRDLEMKNALKLDKDRIVRISQKKRRIRYTPPGKYCKLPKRQYCLTGGPSKLKHQEAPREPP